MKQHRDSHRFCWMYIFYFGGYMSFFSFYGVFLRQQGFSAAHLGLLATGTSAANLLALVVSGLLADRVAVPRRLLLPCGALSAVAGLLLLPASFSLAGVFAVIVPISCLDFALLGLLDAWTNSAARQDPTIQYSVARGFGSLAGALVCLGLGQLLYRLGTGNLVWFHLGFYLLLLGVVIRTRTASEPLPARKSSETGRGLFPGYGLFLGSTLLVFLGWRALTTYLPTLVVDLGGDSRQQGWIMAEMSLSSMAGLWLYPRLRRRAGPAFFLMTGAFCMVVRLVAMAFVGGLPLLALVQCLELLSYGLFQPAAMEYITHRARPGCRATALSLYTALQMPAGTILANAITVPLLERATLQQIFGLFGLLALAGTAGLALLLIRYNPTRREGGSHA